FSDTVLSFDRCEIGTDFCRPHDDRFDQPTRLFGFGQCANSWRASCITLASWPGRPPGLPNLAAQSDTHSDLPHSDRFDSLDLLFERPGSLPCLAFAVSMPRRRRPCT